VTYGHQASGILTRVQRIRGALAAERFVLHAQPILDLRRGEVACHELLIRMLSDDGGLIPPAAFIPPAERFGLIGEIDRWVTGQALRLAAHGRRVTINLSAKSLADPGIVAAVRDEVNNGLDPRNVIFEITETAAVANTADASELARTLTGIGCELALDDFGTGFGSFSYLKHFPARYLKIDADFVRQARNDATDQAIIRSICGVARALGKETIAEGVEDSETLEILRRQGVDYAQGFFIGRPVPFGGPHRLPPTCGGSRAPLPRSAE
jgi:EAL domain-containing protein (putative c-di-GMP-specific phosphodiesterase class I)